MSRLSAANEAKLRQLIREFRVEKCEAWILRHAMECILLHVDKPDEYQQKGNSRIGGVPDIPASFSWPQRADGKYLSFLMQLDLAALPVLSTNDLPRVGHLYVFVGDDENSDNVEHKLIYDATPGAGLSRATSPRTSQMASESLVGLKAFLLTSELALSVPETVVSEQWKDRDVDVDDEVWDAYSDMRQALHARKGEPPSQLFGYSSFFGDDPARTSFYVSADRTNVERESLENLEASLKEWEADGNQLSIATLKQQIADYHWYQAHREEVEAGVKQWRLLLQIESNVTLNLWWWDAGAVQVMIRHADLKRHHFDDTHMTLFTN